MAAFDSLNSVFVHALNPIYGVSGGLQWWEPLTMVQAGNKTYDLFGQQFRRNNLSSLF